MGDGPGDENAGGFNERLNAARAKHGLDAKASAPGSASAGTYGIGLRVGVELVSALAVSVLIGWGLDAWLGTRPWMLGLFVLLGGAAGVANVWRLMMPAKKG